MANELLKRFVNEVMKEPELYNYYLNNPLMIQEKFSKFYFEQERNNKEFAKLIEKYHLVKSQDRVVETVLSLDLDNISTYLKNQNKNIFKSSYGTIKVSDAINPIINNNTCYISNGFYQNTKEIIKDILTYPYGPTKPSFIIGVVERPTYIDDQKINSVFYEENLDKIKEFQKELHKKKVPITVRKENKDKCNAYILIHRGDRI